MSSSLSNGQSTQLERAPEVRHLRKIVPLILVVFLAYKPAPLTLRTAHSSDSPQLTFRRIPPFYFSETQETVLRQWSKTLLARAAGPAGSRAPSCRFLSTSPYCHRRRNQQSTTRQQRRYNPCRWTVRVRIQKRFVPALIRSAISVGVRVRNPHRPPCEQFRKQPSL